MKTKEVCHSVSELKQQILLEFGSMVADPIVSIGYIEPGHGLRGKQNWLTSASDVQLMYMKHHKKQIVLFLLMWVLNDDHQSLKVIVHKK